MSRYRSDPDVTVTLRGAARAARLADIGGARHVVIDVDGCLTPGYQVMDESGSKPVKVFGLDDFAALMRWWGMFDVTAVTSDLCPPTIARLESWGVPLTEAPAESAARVSVIRAITGSDLMTCVYIGDGYHDASVMHQVGFGIAPADAWPETARAADGVTSAPGGRRAVALALDFIGENLLASPGQGRSPGVR
jgi:3-deoxy-D-manno-octulosonate 8-phosphate phosphatase (KDO 8-P phosphatase)